MNRNLLLSLFLLLCISIGCKQEKPQTIEQPMETSESSGMQDIDKERQIKYILFFGNSLTAGYGLEEEQSFPSIIQSKIDSLGLPFKTINAGLSGETTANGLERIDWILKQDIDVFVLELGANDMLRGLKVDQTKSNLQGILKKVITKNPNCKLVVAGMKAAPNMGQEYVLAFDNIFPQLAEEFNASLIPFLLKDVASIEKFNLADGKHPNIEGQEIVAQNVWKVISKVLD